MCKNLVKIYFIEDSHMSTKLIANLMKFHQLFLFLILFGSISVQGQEFALDWANRIGGPERVDFYAIEKDSIGNIFTSGSFTDTIDVDPGLDTFYLSKEIITGYEGGTDGFLCKYDSTGEFIWAKQFPGGYTDKIAIHDIAISDSGYIYLAGAFTGMFDFDPSIDSTILTSSVNINNNSLNNSFICKLNLNGEFIWAKQFGGNYGSINSIVSIGLDDLGNVYSSGNFSRSSDFDPGPESYLIYPTTTGSEIFMSKLDLNGNFVWAKKIGGTQVDEVSEMVMDDYFNMYLTGKFGGTMDFDPDTGIYNLSTESISEVFICKIDSSASLLWAKQLAENGSVSGSGTGRSICLDEFGKVYVSGYFNGEIDFDPGSSTYNLTAEDFYSPDAFVLKLDSLGDFEWAKHVGGEEAEFGGKVLVDDQANVIAMGSFKSTADFDPWYGTHYLTSEGGYDTYILKLDSLGDFIWAGQMGGPENNFAGDAILDNSGNPILVGKLLPEMDLDPCSGQFSFNVEEPSDTYMVKFRSCSNSYDTIDIIACNQYIPPSGNYSWNYSGVYQDRIPNAAGCDSVLIIDLTIESIYTDVNIIGASLESTMPNASYQWMDCNTMSPIQGATNQLFTPTVNGSYAVEIFGNNCSDTSNCFEVNNVGLSEYNFQPFFSISPNPASDRIHIKVNASGNGWIHLVDISGKVLLNSELISGKLEYTLFLDDMESGLYFIEVFNDGVKYTSEKMVKK